MGKGNQKGKSSSKGGGTTTSSSSSSGGKAWSFEEHSTRVLNKIDRLSKRSLKQQNHKSNQKKNNNKNGSDNYYKRSFLAHDGRDQIEAKKLGLHITKIKREIEKWRKRLRQWDDVTEQRREREERAEQERRKLEKDAREQAAFQSGPKKRKRRPGPETWKLRGAARPAHEVYDFDTRYVDPFLKEHEEAKAKAKRSRNILIIYKGQFASNSQPGPPQPACRHFLSLLVQLGHLCVEAKKFKSARESFLECIDLEGDNNNGDPSITNARSHLMRMYMEANRPESARRLWERFPMDSSSWVRYSAALVEYVSWKLLKEEGSTEQTAERLLAHAIQSNVFCAFYLAFHSTFESVMEFTQDIEEAHERTLEEAIEYCSSEQMGAWLGTDGALQWIKNILLIVMQTGKSPHSFINRTHLGWNHSLTEAEVNYQKEHENNDSNNSNLESINEGNDDSDTHSSNANEDEEGEEEEGADFLMYAGMFRTAMEMLEEAGEFNANPIYNDDNQEEDSSTVDS